MKIQFPVLVMAGKVCYHDSRVSNQIVLFSASNYTSVSLISGVAVENNNQALWLWPVNFVPTSYKTLCINL